MRTRFLGTLALALATSASAQFGMLSPNSENGWVSVPHAADLEPTGALTVEGWFNYDPSAPGGSLHPTIIRKSATFGDHPYFLRADLTSPFRLQFGIWSSTTGYTGISSASGPPLLGWRHAAGVYDGAEMRIYVDGALVASGPKTGPLLQTSSALLIGGGFGAAETWKGRLDEVRVWNVARTQAQLQNDRYYRLDFGDGLVGAWHFDEDGPADSVGGHGGSLVGGASVVPSTSPVVVAQLTAPTSSILGLPIPFALWGVPDRTYYLEIGFAGTSPGIPLGSPFAPLFRLNPPFLFFELGAQFPAAFDGFIGTFDADGNAAAGFRPPTLLPLVGVPFSAAFVTFAASGPPTVAYASNATTTTIAPPTPVVLSASPAQVVSGGGTTVALTGVNFQPGATLAVDGAVVPATVVDGTTIVFSAPPHAPGAVVLSVTNPDGGFGATGEALTYLPPLVVSGASPVDAVAGATVTLSGEGFMNGAAVTVGGLPATVLTTSSVALSYVQPAGAPCQAVAHVALPDGQSAQTAVNPPPTVTALIGGTGPAIGGGTAAVVGAAFSTAPAVTVGGSPATVVSATSNVVFFVVPPGAPGSAPIVVSTPAGCTATSTYVYF